MHSDCDKISKLYTHVCKKLVNEVTFNKIRSIPAIGRHSLSSEEGVGVKTNLPSIQAKLFSIGLENAYATKQPLLVFGPPGTAKSATIIDFAKKMAPRRGRIFKYWNKCSETVQREILQNPSKYFVLVDVRTVRYEPTDITGVPVPIPDSTDRTLVTMKYPWIVFLCKQDADGILFFDEINQGSKPMLNSLMGIALDRDFDGVPMSPDISIVAAGNLEGGYSNDLPPALMNRFSAGVLTIDPDAWLKWAKGSAHDDEDEQQEEGEVGPRVDSWITSFVEHDKKRYTLQKPVIEGNTPFPSWRALEKLSHKMHFIEQKHNMYYRQHVVPEVSMLEEIAHEAAMLCGVDWAQDFMLFIGYTSNYSIEEIVKDPLGFTERNLSEKRKVEDKDVAVLERGRVYSFITWLSNQCVDAFREISSDPSYKQIFKRENEEAVIEKDVNFFQTRDLQFIDITSRELESKKATQNTIVLVAFVKSFVEVLTQNDDKAVLKDSIMKSLGNKGLQFLRCIAKACKNTGLASYEELSQAIGKIAQETKKKPIEGSGTPQSQASFTTQPFATKKTQTNFNTPSVGKEAPISTQQTEFNF